MKSNLVLQVVLASFCLAAFLTAAAQDQSTGGDVVHAVAGTVKKIDGTAKTIAIATANGTEHVFKYTAKTTVSASKAVANGAKTGALATYMAGKEGTRVVVRYTVKGSEKTAVGVEDFGKDALKDTEGVVTHVDKGARTVAVKTADGTEATYDVAKDATIDTGHGIVKGTEWTAKEGDKVTVHYTEEGGKKLVHLFKSL